jgi:putative tricarboxylic transport membrane protein
LRVAEISRRWISPEHTLLLGQKTKGPNVVKRFDYISGLVLFILAIVLLFQARGLSIWGEDGPSEGFFPFVLSMLLGILSAVILIQAFVKSRQASESIRILGPKKRKFFSYIISFFIFGFIFSKVGYSVTLVTFLIFILRIVERQPWKLTLIVTVLSVICSYFAFDVFLKVSMPEGFLTPVINLLR